jgi:hypothetical protein
MSSSAVTPNSHLVARIHFRARAKASNKSHVYKLFDFWQNYVVGMTLTQRSICLRKGEVF